MTSPTQYREAAIVRVDLPWPSRDLHPNARVHWATRARAAGIGRMEAEALHVTVIFTPPNNRAHDLDGLLSNVKSYLDGIVDVVGIDDRHWRISPVKESARPRGNVRVIIEPVDTWEHISEPMSRVISAIPVPRRGAA